jgi:hypothetical protein
VTHALRKAGWAPVLLATVGCAVLAVSYAHPHRAEVLPRFGGLALVFASGLIGFRAATATLARDLAQRAWPAWREERAHVLLMALIVLAAVALRAEFIDEPMRYDESYSFLHFVARPLEVGLIQYTRATNHIFHTLLAHFSWVAFGSAPPALRLPALVAGVGVAPAAYLAGRALYDRDTGLLAAALVAPSAVLIEYSVNARGYTIVCLAFLLLIGLGAYLVARPNPAGWIAWAAIAAIGLYTTPIMIFALLVAVAWMALRIALEAPRERRVALARDLVLAVVGAGVTALALYVPTLDQPGWSYEHPAHWGLLGRIWGSWNADIPAVVRGVLAGGAAAAVLLHRRIGRQRVPVAAAVAALLLVLPLVPEIPSYARMWLFLLPLYLLLSAAGLVALLRLVAPRAAPMLASGMAIAAVVGLGVSLRAEDLPNGGDPPLRDGEAAVRFLKPRLRPGDRVVVSALTAPNFRYYFRRLGLSPKLVVLQLRWNGQTGRSVLIVSRVRHETLAEALRGLRRRQPGLPAPRLLRAYRWESVYELGR